MLRAWFYKHPGQIFLFITETVGIVKSKTIEHSLFSDPSNIIILAYLT